MPVDIVMDTPEQSYQNANDHSEAIIERFKKIYAFMISNQQATICRNTKLYSNDKEFTVNDILWYLRPREISGKPSKITDQWIGPYRVIERCAAVLYKTTGATKLDKK